MNRTRPHVAPRRPRRGFTLIEMVVIIAVVAILGALATMGFNGLRSRRSVHDAAREVVAQIYRMRSAVVSGRLETTSGPLGGGGGPTVASLDGDTTRLQGTGIRIDNDRTLTFYGSTNDAAGADTILSVIDLEERFPSGDVRVSTPSPGENIRFRRNATLATTDPTELVLADAESGLRVRIRISLAGVPRIL
jgi:prepilin-type N-terminal cleavage/methylation domain-containing protein